MPLGDGVRAVEGITDLEHPRHREVRTGEAHRRLVLVEVVAPSTEPGDEIAIVEPERKRAGPVAANELGHLRRPSAVQISRENLELRRL